MGPPVFRPSFVASWPGFPAVARSLSRQLAGRVVALPDVLSAEEHGAAVDALALLYGLQVEVVLDHSLHELLEGDGRLPAEHLLGLARVAHQHVHFARPHVVGIELDEVVPVQVQVPEDFAQELPHGVRLARRDDEVIGLVVLEHEPHGPHVV